MAENLGTSFSIDVTKLKAGLQQANRLIRESESEFKAAAAGIGDWSKSQEGLEKRIKSLNDIAGVQQKKVDALKSEYNRLIKEGLDPSSDKAITLRTQINKETEALNKSKAEIDKNQKALNDLGKESDDASKDVKKLKDETDKGSGSFTIMKGALADLVASGIKAAIQGFKDLAGAAVDAFKEVDEGRDNVIKATGATGDAAKDLEESYKNVAKSIKGDFGTIGSALGEVNTRFGFTGDELEDTTKQFLKFSEITGTDATSAVQMVSRAMEGAGIDSKDYSKILDELAIAAQASGISVDKMAEGLTKYGAPMRQLGFDTSDTIAIFAQFEKAGINTETAFAGMQKAVQNWSKDGKDAKTEFQKVVDLISKTPDKTKATQIAMDNFGKKAGPELADAIKSGRLEYDDFLKIIQGSEGTVNNTYKETQDGFDKLGVVVQGVKTDMADFISEIMDKYGPQIEKFIQKVSEAAQKIISWCIEHLPQIEAALAGIVTAFLAFKAVSIVMKAITLFKSLATTIQLVKTGQLAMNAAMLANPIGIIVAAIAGLVAAFVVLWNKCEGFREFWINLWETIKEVAGAVWDAIVEFFSAAWDKIKAVWSVVKDFFAGIWEGIKAAFSAVGDWFSNIFKNAWNGIKNAFSVCVQFFKNIWTGIKNAFAAVGSFFTNIFSNAWTGIKNAFSTVGSFFSNIWEGIKKPFLHVADWFKNIFSKAWQAVKNVFSTGGKIFDGIKDGIVTAFKAVVNAIIKGINKVVAVPFDGINWALKKLKDLSILGLHPFKWIKLLSVPQIPTLATGGVVRKATNAIIGEDGAEAVVPLEKNTGWMDVLAEKIAGKAGGGVVVNQTNNYSQAHSRYEIFKSQQMTAKAVKLALAR